MRRTIMIVLTLLALILAGSVVVVNAEALANGFSIPWWTVDSGGGASQGGSYALKGTIGQPDAGNLSGGGYTLTGGFWSITKRETRLYLPVVTR